MSAATDATGGGATLRPDAELVRACWEALVVPGDTHEVRIPKCRRGPAGLYKTTAGYFTDGEAAVRAVRSITGRDAPAVYLTLNPVKPELRARANNRLETNIAATTTDQQVTRRRHLLVDLDPTRASEIAATDDERAEAIAVRDAVAQYLTDQGWTDPVIIGMTGNGGELVYRIDLPNDEASSALIQRTLASLAALFDDPVVTVDQSVFNAGRITKLLGTVSAKGDNVPELGRVWQLTTGTVNPNAAPVTREQLEALAGADVPENEPQSDGTRSRVRFEAASARGKRSWTVAEVLTRTGIGWHERSRTYGTIYDLDRCLTSSEHSDGAALVEMNSGALDYKCHHNSCRGKGWAEARAALDLGTDGGAASNNASGTGATVNAGAAEPWPEPERQLDLPPAPVLDLSLFPPEVANIALDASQRLQCPPDYVAWGLMVCLAGLIGRRVGIRPKQRDDWTERACLWVALVGEPSWMKSPALDVARRPLKRQDALDHERHEYELADWEAHCDALRAAAKKGEKPKLPPKPVAVRRVTSDATIEKLADMMAPSPGLTLIRDEIAGWVGAFNRYTRAEGDRQFFLESYSGGPYTVDRISRGTVRVPDTYLNILGGAQPDRARDIFGEGPDDGFAARVTAVYPAMPPDWRHVDRWPDKAARDALDAVCDRLVEADWNSLLLRDDWKPLPYCRLDPEAGGLWTEWHGRTMTDLRGGKWEGRHAGRIGKYPGVAARLALISHLVDWAAGRVPDDALARVPALTMARILDLMDGYVSPMDDRVYCAFDRTAAASGAERIARWITSARPASFTLRELRRHEWAGLTDPSAIAAAVEWLASKGWVREADPEQRLGRPANRYLVNPRVWEVPS